MSQPTLQDYYSVKEAAEIVGLSYMALHQRIHRGSVQVNRVGERVILIHRDVVEQLKQPKCKKKKSKPKKRKGKKAPKEKHPLKSRYLQMIRRCYNPNYHSYHRYGGRGIKVCDRWLNSFEDYVKDLGMPPTPQHTVDRYPNPDGNYEPGNVRWATRKEQASNKGRNRCS